MTVAIALRDGEDVWLAADGRTIIDGENWVTVEKIFTLDTGPALTFAGAGRHRVAEEIHWRWTPPAYEGDPDAHAFVLAASLEDHFGQDHLWRMLKESDESALDLVLLAAYAGRAYVIGGDFTVTPVPAGGYLAIGCGAAIAMGAMFATRGRTSPRARLQLALQACGAYDSHIGPPWQVVKVPRT